MNPYWLQPQYQQLVPSVQPNYVSNDPQYQVFQPQMQLFHQPQMQNQQIFTPPVIPDGRQQPMVHQPQMQPVYAPYPQQVAVPVVFNQQQPSVSAPVEQSKERTHKQPSKRPRNKQTTQLKRLRNRIKKLQSRTAGSTFAPSAPELTVLHETDGQSSNVATETPKLESETTPVKSWFSLKPWWWPW